MRATIDVHVIEPQARSTTIRLEEDSMEIRIHGALATLVAFMACSSLPAQASTAAREGTKITVAFTATVKSSGRFVDGGAVVSTSEINRVLKGRCRLEAGTVAAHGLDGPSKKQEKAMRQKDRGMANLEQKHARCKGDRDCLMALARKMSERDFEPQAPQAEGAVQVWYPQSCSGSFSADDVFTKDHRDATKNLSYQSRSTITGTALIPEGGEKGWLAIYIEHDLASNSTQYRFSEAEPVLLEKQTVRTVYQAGTTRNKVPVGLTQRVDTKPWGPVKGPLQSVVLARNIEGGTLTLEWQIQR